MFTAQLKTTYRNESGLQIEMVKVFESMKNIRKQYENGMEEHSIWENTHNSIGLSSWF